MPKERGTIFILARMKPVVIEIISFVKKWSSLLRKKRLMLEKDD